MRSLLFVPGDSEKKLQKALSSGADALLIDLEDSVAASNKSQARVIAAAFLAEAKKLKPHPILFVRVNALDTGLTDADLDAVMVHAPDGIMLPKSLSGQSVQHLAAKLAVREAENNLPDGSTGIIAIATETASSLFHMGTYAGASRRLIALTWGAEDLSADIGAETSRLSDGSLAAPYQLARTLTLLAATNAGVSAIDSIRADFRDAAALRIECEAARRDGFTGKMAIHPAQVATINEIFTPSPAAVAQAEKIVAAFRAQPDAGVVALDDEMFDLPHLRRAERILARAELNAPST
ncbi:HpcH/HpaI aldolase/citrate lyase family protein [Methylovirgula sp. 4M-Z18]|uniref:HpcH/HpaI aldolase/citrate lyase family protein n=1 Tax=Methylovirgula sp. 4M-Z18 TaxID=2293567 RepID=UPI000E2ED8D2|nr:CoA ester lyase [Methylovirgula sp. 4M-Z18]RFB81152.1 CoA ester lyase [Methylovirgula sp. 4M-Z18]